MEAAIARIDDAKLLRLYASKGDPAAFAELVKRYADMVYATARRVTGSAASAEDVAQDCFLRLAQRSAAVTGSLAAWLHRTTLNRSLEILRSERARQRRETRAAAEANLEVNDADGDEAAELVSRVDEALAALPEDLRVVVTEHFLCDRNQSDIAAALGLSQPTVSRRIEKGLVQLRKWLQDNGANSAASVALPAFFAQAMKFTAPSALRPSLVKIGLSGVRGPAVVWPWFAKPLALAAFTVAAVTVVGTCAWYMVQSPHDTQIRLSQPLAAAGDASPPLAVAAGRFDRVRDRDHDGDVQTIVAQIPVGDVEISKQFYLKLGFKPLAAPGAANGLSDTVGRDDQRMQLALKTPPFVGPVSVNVLVHNLLKVRQSVIDQKIALAPSPVSSYDTHSFAVFDPDGNRLVFEDEELHEQH